MNTVAPNDVPTRKVFWLDHNGDEAGAGAWYWAETNAAGEVNGAPQGPFDSAVDAGRAARDSIIAALPAEHTPGPWTFIDSPLREIALKRAHWLVGRLDNDKRGLALVFGDDDTNARLIAAAPDLLALAQQYASECAECNGTGSVQAFSASGHPAGTLDCDACASIREVVANATGRHPHERVAESRHPLRAGTSSSAEGDARPSSEAAP
jgi:hypothetical protein